MILLADSGSTKTDWVLFNRHDKAYHRGSGINPHVQNADDIKAILAELPFEDQAVQAVYFYGAGCEDEVHKRMIADQFRHRFDALDRVEIHGDLMGTARALCGRSPAYVGILGTGSNFAHFDGENLKQAAPSQGYLLGDEGSGNNLGKGLIKAFFENKLPAAIKDNMRSKTDMDTYIVRLYQHQLPNRFLAEWAPLVIEHKAEPWASELIHNSLQAYYEHQIKPNLVDGDYPVHFCGSIAEKLQEELGAFLHSKKMQLGLFKSNIMDALIEYHS